MDFLGQVLVVVLEQLHGLHERLEHGVGGLFPVAHAHQVWHDADEGVVVALFRVAAQALRRHVDELVQLPKAGDNEKVYR